MSKVMKNVIMLGLLAGVLIGCGGDPQKKKATAQPEKDGQQTSAVDYRKEGMDYAMAVQGALGKTLQGKIKETGTAGAIEFCNVRALAITDSVARTLGASISRITDQPRNPQNRANAEEMKFISNFRAELAAGQAPEPLIVRQDSLIYFYYPILTNNLCLQCHGKRDSDIAPEVYQKLEILYPEDKAVAYSANQLRGLWKVAFNE